MRCACFLPLVAAFAVATRAWGLDIQIDYQYDTGGFFTQNAQAKTALEAAVSTLEGYLTISPTELSQQLFTANDGTRTININWTRTLVQPTSGVGVTLPALSQSNTLPANTFVIYAGARSLNSGVLGSGAFESATESIGVTPSGTPNSTVFNNTVAASNAAMSRGVGPTIGTRTGSAGTLAYTLNYGLLGGSVWFDSDMNDDQSADSAVVAAQFWHFDPNAPPPAGKFDFYTVAMRSLLYTLGYKEGGSWRSQIDGTTWKGERAVALYGTGEGLVTATREVNPDLPSFRITDGEAQPLLLASGLGTGERRLITTGDVAMLFDAKVPLSPTPEPGVAGLLLAGALVLGARRRSR